MGFFVRVLRKNGNGVWSYLVFYIKNTLGTSGNAGQELTNIQRCQVFRFPLHKFGNALKIVTKFLN